MTQLYTKKLEHLINSFLPKHIIDTYPKYVDFIKVYLRFLDSEIIAKTLTIKENTNANTVWSNLLDDYLDNYFKDVIDLDKFSLTDANKRTYLTLSKFINNLKGNKKSIDFLFRTLSNFRIADDSGDVDIDKLIIDYEENEDWWKSGIINYHDTTIIYDGTEDHEADFDRPFTYRFTVNQERDAIINLISSIHPAGFEREFQTIISFSDNQDMLEELNAYITRYLFYNQNNTVTLHDGSVTHSEYSTTLIGE